MNPESVQVSGKPIRLIILGYGIRGRTYAAYAMAHPDEYKVVGIAEPFGEVPDTVGCSTWKGWREALESDVEADAVVIALPDRLHHDSCIKALERGYHVLLEKPIGCTWEDRKSVV